MNLTALPRFLFGAFLLLLLNSAYLVSFADPTIFYLANLLLHLGLGIILFLLFFARTIKTFAGLRILGKSGTVLLITGGILGLILIGTGAYRPFRFLLLAHILFSASGAVLFCANLYAQYRCDAARVLVLVLVLAFFVPITIQWQRKAYPDSQDRIVNPAATPSTMFEEGGGPKGSFFPSSAVTNTGKTIPSTFFVTPETCKRCHEDIYNQWFSSAHHFSSFNNQWYRKSIEYMQDVIGTKPSKWCGGCHDHAVLFNGMMDTPIRKILQTPEAQAGLTCNSCHAIAHIRSTMGQGDFLMEYPALHDLAASENPLLQKVHDFLVFTDPGPHKKVFMKPFVRKDTPQFCSACHKVHLDVPVNNYRWVRGFNEYDNWQSSGVSGQGARSFYYPPKPQKCADCHMPLVNARDPAAINGKVHSHRFPGANTALPFVNQDAEQLRVTEEFLKAGQVSVDIFAYGMPSKEGAKELQTKGGEGPEVASTFALGEESSAFGTQPAVIRKPLTVIGPIDKVNGAVLRGGEIRLEVVVRTRKVGHFFPGGTVDAFDVWLELQAVDEDGRVLFWSGRVENEGKGPVEKGAHFYRSLLLDAHGNPINKRNAWAARSVAYVRLIPPGAADTAHFRLKIPKDCGDQIFLKARLNYRKFAWWNTQWAFAGIRDPKQKNYALAAGYDDGYWVFQGDTSGVSGRVKAIPNLPIVIMAQDEATLRVLDAEAPNPSVSSKFDSEDRERWNDYGIGLLLQGDLKGAEEAFGKVTQIDPKYPDGWINIARARIQEGDIDGAQEVLKKALALNPELAKSHFFYAMTLKAKGQYDAALHHLRVAANKYPLDRVVRNQLGRILFLQRRFNDAITEFRKTLQIDPEDLPANYNLMLCYQGLKNNELAEKQRRLYLRFKAEEASQSITGPYRLLHPEDNNERQPIHEHKSAM